MSTPAQTPVGARGSARDSASESARDSAGDRARLEAHFGGPERWAEVRRQLRGELTFGGLFVEFMRLHSKPKKKTWREDQRNYDRHLAPTLGKRKLSSLARKDFAQLHTSVSRGAPAHANKVLALCSVMFNWAINAGLWDGANPAAGIKKNKVKQRDRFLTVEGPLDMITGHIDQGRQLVG